MLAHESRPNFQDVEDKVKIITITDKIPNDPFVFRKDLPQEITDKFVTVVKKFIATEEGKRSSKTSTQCEWRR